MVNFKKIIFVAICLLPLLAFGQNRVGQTMPNIMMRLIDGKVFNSNTLSQDKPIVLFYFSADCDHCEKLTQTLFSHKQALANKNIIMVTFGGMPEVIHFAQKNKLEKFPHLFIGSEGNRFVVPKFLGIQQFPFVALLTPQQKIVRTFNNTVSEMDILKAVSGKW